MRRTIMGGAGVALGLYAACHPPLDLRRGLGALCDASAPCRDGLACAADGTCHTACSAQQPCPAKQTCAPEGACFPQASTSSSSVASASASGTGGSALASSSSSGGAGGGGGTGGAPNPPCWIPVTKVGAPVSRSMTGTAAIWSGSQVVVWGGVGAGDKFLADGGMYEPTNNSWQPMATSGAPTGRADTTMIWTGSKAIVWGGFDDNAADIPGDGGRFDPQLNSWAPVATSGAPQAADAGVVWTGDKMVFWAGFGVNDAASTQLGGRYSPKDDNWSPTSTGANVLGPRGYPHTIWDDKHERMLIWGGLDRNTNQPVGDGAYYDPGQDSWSPIASANAPSARWAGSSVWTGSTWIVWGGTDKNGVLNTGAVYDPTNDKWSPITTANAPSARSGHAAVWSGWRMLVWGGIDINNNPLNDGAEYDPANDKWTPLTGEGALSARYDTAFAWTGTGLFVWSGRNGSPSYADDGAIYYPVCPNTCGDGKKEGSEQCDGADLGGATCATAVAPGWVGTLGCTAQCKLDTSKCTTPATTYNDVTSPSYWQTFDVSSKDPNAKGFVGGAFDGKYVYLTPAGPGEAVAQYDATKAFNDPASWVTFDATKANGPANGFEGAAFDGAYVYFVGESLTGRYDPTKPFDSANSWSMFDVSTVNGNGAQFSLAAFDGRFLYLGTYLNSGFIARYDTTMPFNSNGSWLAFDVSQVTGSSNKSFQGFAFDGKYLYLAPGNPAYNTGVALRYDTTKQFDDKGSWLSYQLGASSYFGAAFDGKFVYFVPQTASSVARYDTTKPFGDSGSWLTFNAAGSNLVGAVFDGRYVHFVPTIDNNAYGTFNRYDTTMQFDANGSWQAVDVPTVSNNAGAKGFAGGIFDGRYVYLVPTQIGAVVARFDAKSPSWLPKGWNASFF